MKKKLVLLAVCLMAALALLGGCKEKPRPVLPPATDNGGNTAASNNNSAVGDYPTSDTAVYLTADGRTEYKLYSTLDKTYTERFQTSFKKKTGVDLELVADTSGDRLIILGTGDELSSVEGLNATPTYTAARIKVIGEKVYIAIANSEHTDYLSTMLSRSTDALLLNMTKSRGNWLLDKSFDRAEDYAGISTVVPVHDKAEEQTYEGAYTSKNGDIVSCQIGYTGAVSAENSIDAYGQKLVGLGYILHDDNTINGNEFATYTNATKDMIVHLNWFKDKGIFRIIYNRIEYLPAARTVTGYNKIKTPTLSMLQLDPADPGGLSMVAQLEDGRFIIIDGGIKKESHKTRLYNFLYENKPSGDVKPRVTWIFTHNHADHVDNAIDFLKDKWNTIKLELVIINYPDYGTVGFGNRELANKLMSTISESHPGAKIYVPHAGEQLFFPGLEIEIYYTQEEMIDVETDDVNNTSLVFKMKFHTSGGTTTCMVFGDSMDPMSHYGYKLYGSALKSDVMQVPHHGAGTASWSLYSAVDPLICLWSTERQKFENDPRMLGTERGRSYNKKLRDDSYGIRIHYHHSQITTINMTTLVVSTKEVA